MSKIKWTERTWNPVTGCTKVSPGCKHCYAETMAKRLHAMGAPGYDNGFKLSLLPERLSQRQYAAVLLGKGGAAQRLVRRVR